MSTKYVVDASVWIEYLDGAERGKAFVPFLEHELFTTALCVAEVVSKVTRMGKEAAVAQEAIRALSDIIPLDFALATNGGLLHGAIKPKKPKLSLSDAITVIAARHLHATTLTFDYDFLGFENVRLLKR